MFSIDFVVFPKMKLASACAKTPWAQNALRISSRFVKITSPRKTRSSGRRRLTHFRRRPHITMRHHSVTDFADDTLQLKCGATFLSIFAQCIYVTLGSDEVQTTVQPYDSTFVFRLKLVAKNVKIVRLSISYKRMEVFLFRTIQPYDFNLFRNTLYAKRKSRIVRLEGSLYFLKNLPKSLQSHGACCHLTMLTANYRGAS